MSLVTLNEARAFCQMAGTAEDAALQLIIDGAEAYVFEYTHLALVADASQPVTVYLDGNDSPYLFPNEKPILNVSEIVDQDSTAGIPLETANYRWTSTYIISRSDNVIFGYCGGVFGLGVKRWKVTMTRGYDASTLPAGLKMAILMLVRRWFDNRSGLTSQSDGFSQSWDNLVDGAIGQVLDQYKAELDMA